MIESHRRSFPPYVRILLRALCLCALLPLGVSAAHATTTDPTSTPPAPSANGTQHTLHLPMIANSFSLANVATPEDEESDDAEIEPGPHANWDVDDADALPATSVNGLAAATDCLGSPTRQIRYTSDGVIHLEGCGQRFTLSEVAAAPAVGPDRLQLVDPAGKIWFLKVKLKVHEGATLTVIGGASGDANWLRLRSDDSSGIWLKAENGKLLFKDTKVTSWDAGRNNVDTSYEVAADGTGGRSFIAARSIWTEGRPTLPPTECGVNGGSQEFYEARMDVVNSEIAYLGYNAAESYGLVWKVYSKTPPPDRQLYAMVDVFGDVAGSSFQHNYFGSYSYGAYCMRWTGNTFANNIQYGLDPHDDSDYLTIDGNIFRDNGNHGVICSVECNNIVITNNSSTGNLHGIMLHRNVNGALVQGNTSANNRKAGIAIFDSYDAVVRGNSVSNNGEAAIRLSVGASRNLIENNILTGLAASGSGSGYVIYIYKGSDQPTSGDGLPSNNIFRANQISAYKSPAVKIGDGRNNRLEGNTISGPAHQFEFMRAATGNLISQAEIGKTFGFKLDSSSDVTLEDSRGVIWKPSGSAVGTRAGQSGTRLQLTYASSGSQFSVTALDFTVRPQSGSVTVTPTTWDASRRWSESGASAPAEHNLGGLQPGGCYSASAGASSLGQFTADGNGRISFVAGPASSAVTFEVKACS